MVEKIYYHKQLNIYIRILPDPVGKLGQPGEDVRLPRPTVLVTKRTDAYLDAVHDQGSPEVSVARAYLHVLPETGEAQMGGLDHRTVRIDAFAVVVAEDVADDVPQR